ncbi:MAG: hypothetical protein H3C35_13020 [Bacteroidetes bacterium]|nr:hypothetical protein [Bacteroidota bacterium]
MDKLKLIYSLKRHATGIIFVLFAALLLSLIGNIIFIIDSTNVVTLGILRCGFFTALMLLVTHFVFPKLDIQERIKDNAIAVAIFIGFVWLAYSNVF